jgi:hypothetical protein
MIMKLYGFVKNFFCLFDWWKSWIKTAIWQLFWLYCKEKQFCERGIPAPKSHCDKTTPTQITKTNAVGSETTTKALKNSQIQKSTQHKKTNSMSNNNKNINNRKETNSLCNNNKKIIKMSPVVSEPEHGNHSFLSWNCNFKKYPFCISSSWKVGSCEVVYIRFPKTFKFNWMLDWVCFGYFIG